MRRITKPSEVDHAELRGIAEHAVWVAKLEESVEVLEDFLIDAGDPDEPEKMPNELNPDDEDPLAVALAVVRSAYESADQELEDELIAWLQVDPEYWPIFRLIVLDPWQTQPGRWRKDVPRWIRSLGTNAAIAHFLHDPYGRNRQVEL